MLCNVLGKGFCFSILNKDQGAIVVVSATKAVPADPSTIKKFIVAFSGSWDD